MKLAALALLLALPALAQERVQQRLLVKERHLFISGGATMLSRGDYYDSPGAVVSAAWYKSEETGIELRAAFFFSRLSAAGREVFTSTGLLPDAHRPVSLLTLGVRRSLTYGKVALGSAVVHFDVQAGAHGGGLLTDRAFTPAASASLGLVARITPRFHAQLDVAALGSLERRSRMVFALGVLPLLTLGVEL
jgi:hypothetical protein